LTDFAAVVDLGARPGSEVSLPVFGDARQSGLGAVLDSGGGVAQRPPQKLAPVGRRNFLHFYKKSHFRDKSRQKHAQKDGGVFIGFVCLFVWEQLKFSLSRTGDKGPEVFYEVQCQVVQTLEDKYYQSFLMSDYYKEMVSAMEKEDDISDIDRSFEDRQLSGDSLSSVDSTNLNVGDHSNYAKQKLDQLEERLHNKSQVDTRDRRK
jgi:hypothetical protein